MATSVASAGWLSLPLFFACCLRRRALYGRFPNHV
ncbi:GlyGly-CTERM sorting domain-containing protein [Collinsella aerofaciens]